MFGAFARTECRGESTKWPRTRGRPEAQQLRRERPGGLRDSVVESPRGSARRPRDLAPPRSGPAACGPLITSMSEVTRTHLHIHIPSNSSLRATSKARAIPTRDAKVVLVRPRSMSWRCFGSRCARSESFSWDRPQLLRNSRMRLPSLAAITRTAGEARAAERHFRPSALLRGDGTHGASPWPD